MLGIAGRLQRDNFMHLDAPIEIVGSVDTPAIPLNSELELALLPNGDSVKEKIEKLLKF
jgi:2-oxoisovalerate dehydrogenase E1 component